MTLILSALANLFRALLMLLTLPFRLLRRRRRPLFLRFVLKGDLPYRSSLQQGSWLRRRGSRIASLELLRQQIDCVVRDPGVRGVLFEIEGLELSPAKRDVIVQLFGRLRAAGKEVVAFAVSVDTADYALMTSASRILMPPAGRLDLTGYAAEATAIGAFLRNFGVSAHFVRRGDYKTAPELFTRDAISDIQRKTLGGLLDERYADLVRSLAAGRRFTEEVAKAKIDNGPYSARKALSEGLIDGLCSGADLAECLSGTTPRAGLMPAGGDFKQEWRLGSFRAYAATFAVPPLRWTAVRRRPRVAVIPINGMIVSGDAGKLPMGPRMAGAEGIIRALRAAGHDSRARAIVLYVNSPGGSALASELILEQVQRTAKKKPVIAYFDRVAASGGYMVALGAKEIWSGPHAIAGSIGVFAGKFDFSGLMENLGVHREVMTRGENSGLLSLSRPFTEHERLCLEADVEDIYQSFLGHVATARKMSTEEVHARAEGRIYSPPAALAAGLIDQVGGFEEACRRALELADVEGKDFSLALFGAPSRRFSLASVFQQVSGSHLYALWMPWLQVRGLAAPGEFESALSGEPDRKLGSL